MDVHYYSRTRPAYEHGTLFVLLHNKFYTEKVHVLMTTNKICNGNSNKKRN